MQPSPTPISKQLPQCHSLGGPSCSPKAGTAGPAPLHSPPTLGLHQSLSHCRSCHLVEGGLLPHCFWKSS